MYKSCKIANQMLLLEIKCCFCPYWDELLLINYLLIKYLINWLPYDCPGDEESFEEIWEQMSDQEKIARIDDLQKRIFLNIKTKGNYHYHYYSSLVLPEENFKKTFISTFRREYFSISKLLKVIIIIIKSHYHIQNRIFGNIQTKGNYLHY
jgi:hypothetical protein